MLSIFTLGFLALAGLSTGQDSPYTINPDDVRQSDREKWCQDQKASCPLICLQQPDVTTMNTIENDCDPDTLVYSCVCDNDVRPNITEYTLTIPYYVCTEWGTECVKNCNGQNTCQDKCRSEHTCGASNPPKPNNTAKSTTATASKTSEATEIAATGFGGAAATTAAGGGKGAASAMLNLGQSYGMAVVFAGVFAGFAIIL